MSKYNKCNSGNGGKENGNPKDNVFDMDAAVFTSDQFRMHEFKVKRCPRARPHDWTQCPFAHPGEKARRRDPRRYKYSGTACPEFRKSGCCRRGDACPFAHGVFECWLHPSRYRTQLCTDGTSCRRRVCFFAHVESELRHPEDDPAIVEKQVQAELTTEVQTLQQQHLTQALQALLLQTTNPLPPPPPPADRPTNQGQVLAAELLKQIPTTLSNRTGPNQTFPESIDQGNSANALQVAALFQQLQQTVVDKNIINPSQNPVPSEAPTTTLPSTDVQSTPMTDVFNALTQFQQLVSDSSPPVANTPVPSTVGEPSTNALFLSSLLNQNAAKMAMFNGTEVGSMRRSIDNSYLNSLTSPPPQSDPNAAMVAAVAAQFGGSVGFPTVVLQNGNLIPNQQNSMTTTQELNIPATLNPSIPVSMATPSIPVVGGGGGPSMYSMENIQLLLQNPAFSSNLSQLFQMNPGLLQQLTTNANDSGSHIRHSIDNAYLSQLTTDINRFVNNGGVKSGAETQVVCNGMTTAQQEALMMNSELFAQQTPPINGLNQQRTANGLTVSEALIQGLNALKMQIEGTAPLSAPMTIQAATIQAATIPIPNHLQSTTTTTNQTISDNMVQGSSEEEEESNGDGGGGTVSSPDQGIESSE